MVNDWSGEVIFEGSEADALVDALEHGTASADYLREADARFARLYSAEPFNRRFGAAARGGCSEAHGLLSFEEMLARAREIRALTASSTTAAEDIRADRDR